MYMQRNRSNYHTTLPKMASAFYTHTNMHMDIHTCRSNMYTGIYKVSRDFISQLVGVCR